MKELTQTTLTSQLVVSESMSIHDCIFDDSYSPTNGGAIYVNRNVQTFYVAGCSFSRCQAKFDGGAIYSLDPTDVTCFYSVNASCFANCQTLRYYSAFRLAPREGGPITVFDNTISAVYEGNWTLQMSSRLVTARNINLTGIENKYSSVGFNVLSRSETECSTASYCLISRCANDQISLYLEQGYIHASKFNIIRNKPRGALCSFWRGVDIKISESVFRDNSNCIFELQDTHSVHVFDCVFDIDIKSTFILTLGTIANFAVDYSVGEVETHNLMLMNTEPCQVELFTLKFTSANKPQAHIVALSLAVHSLF